jgi:hypothetical protein
MNFQNCFVGFLDVLGFREILKETDRVIQIVSKVESAIKSSNSISSKHGIFPKEPITQFSLSDSIVLSIPVGINIYESYKNLRFLLSAIEKFQFQCALDNIVMLPGFQDTFSNKFRSYLRS